MGGGLENALRPLVNFESDGFIKLVIDIEQLICAQSIAHEGGGKIVQCTALAIQNKITIEARAHQLFPHLTMV